LYKKIDGGLVPDIDGRKARGEASRQAILAAAVKVVAGDGLHGLTHRAVSERLGIAHARVVYHFPSIAELRQATLRWAGERITGQLDDLMNDNAVESHRLDPHLVPHLAGEMAVRLISELRDETVTLFTLMAEATRNQDLRLSVREVTDRVAELVEPLSQDRERSDLAASAFLGMVMTTMAKDSICDHDQLRTQISRLIDFFDPHPRQETS
jgi:DNA-binding transcriptional regulator YbjK